HFVTMTWWDDLWMEEGLKRFAAFNAHAHLSHSDDVWSFFSSHQKQKAYRFDRSPGTHSLVAPVPSTESLKSRGDDLVVGKGTSLLRQLSFFMGRDRFRKALRLYLKNRAYGSGDLDQFFVAMGKETQSDMNQWKERWFKTAMVNQVEVFFQCEKGKIESFELFQTGSQEHPMLRTHKTQVALFRKTRGVFKLNRKVDVVYQGGRTEVPELKGKLCPHVVYPNFNDWDYVQVQLDKKTLGNIESSLGTIQSSALRNLVWNDLWQMLLDRRIDMDRYLEIVEFNALGETDLAVLGAVLGRVNHILRRFYPRQNEAWEQKRQVWIRFFEQTYLTKFKEAIDQEKAIVFWFDHLVQVAESKELQELWLKLLSGKTVQDFPQSLGLDQEKRWELVARLTSLGHPQAETQRLREEKRDPSKRGQLRSLYAQALVPKIDMKKKWLGQLVRNAEKESLLYNKTIIEGLIPESQSVFFKDLSTQYFQSIRQLSNQGFSSLAYQFAKELGPRDCEPSSSHLLNQFISAEKGLSRSLNGLLQELLYENQRCEKMRRRMVSKKTALVDGVQESL
ncbi:MAG: ERAP1-like C-terminal domain-containing protein, partial [Pseudomonadota bacterium]